MIGERRSTWSTRQCIKCYNPDRNNGCILQFYGQTGKIRVENKQKLDYRRIERRIFSMLMRRGTIAPEALFGHFQGPDCVS